MSELIKISLSSKSISLINDIGRSSQPLAQKLREISRNAINESSKLAANSYKSSSPIDSGELRDQFVTTLDQASMTNISATIGIRPGDHIGRDRKPIDAEKLADILNIGIGKGGSDLKRSQSSKNTSPFSSVGARTPTKGWIRVAEREFLQNIQRFLDERNFNY